MSTYNYIYIIGDFSMMSAISMVTVVAMFPGIILSGILSTRIGKIHICDWVTGMFVFSYVEAH